jgi:hypothetical protein
VTLAWFCAGGSHIIVVRDHSKSMWGQKKLNYLFFLSVSGPPKINSNRDQYAKTGSKAKVTCTTISVPKPHKIVWARGQSPLDVKVNSR